MFRPIYELVQAECAQMSILQKAGKAGKQMHQNNLKENYSIFLKEAKYMHPNELWYPWLKCINSTGKTISDMKVNLLS